MGVDEVLELLDASAAAVRRALDGLDDWGPAGTRAGQYRSDLAADDAAFAVLDAAGVGVLSEESGLHNGDRDLLVVVDPVDGSTNASRGIPWYATSLCALDAEGPSAALVVNQATDERFEAVRGAGARRNGGPMAPTGCRALGDALLGMTSVPPQPLGWRQVRVLGAAALDLCAVACGQFDAYADWSRNAHGPWDYLGGMLVLLEAGAVVADALGRDLVTREATARRIPVAAATPELLAEVVAARARVG
ncbi:MAG TPA: inositol monophosphatase [Acidimicrobiales bacterium]|nr:inositol monophosphatase [Acidimicrobiales bacterium]